MKKNKNKEDWSKPEKLMVHPKMLELAENEELRNKYSKLSKERIQKYSDSK